jgi:glycine oxidase
MRHKDVVIAGAGLIGLSCALALHGRGMTVTVVERGIAGSEASSAAAGMLAAHDPANPPQLQPLSDLSSSLYPDFLASVWNLGGIRVPLETESVLEFDEWHPLPEHIRTFQDVAHCFTGRQEDSLDPRKLMRALLAAVRATPIDLLENIEFRGATTGEVFTAAGPFTCGQFLDCRGAWSAAPIRPVKGQMLRVHAPGILTRVVHTHDIYMVPRLDGSIVIGATVEDRGFDKAVHITDIDDLRASAARFIPELAQAPLLESWAGLRPGTPDELPLIGQVAERQFIAAGHYRNGILLAPGTAHVMAQLLTNQTPSIDLLPFAPDRFVG